MKGKLSQKQQLQNLLTLIYNKATSQQQFFNQIQQQGFEIYYRGKEAGIRTATRKFRLRTLGFSRERLAILNIQKTKRSKELDRLLELKQQQIQKDNDQELER